MRGLVTKYHITKADGRPVDPQGMFFVLKLNSDDEAHANASCVAALAYASQIESTNPVLASDVRKRVRDLNPQKGYDIQVRTYARTAGGHFECDVSSGAPLFNWEPEGGGIGD